MSSKANEILLKLDAIQSSPAEVQINIVKELLLILEEDALKLSSGTEELESTIYNDSFPFILILSPLLSSSPSSSAAVSLSFSSLKLFAQHSSARELIMSLGERLTNLGPPIIDEEESEDELEGSDAGKDRGGQWNSMGAIRELVDIIGLYKLILPRIRTAKPEGFLETAIESTLNAIESIVTTGVLSKDEESNEVEIEGEKRTVVIELVESVLAFLESMRDSDWISASISKSTILLQNYLTTLILQLQIPLTRNIAQQYFISRYPRYRMPSYAPTSDEIESLWVKILSTANDLGLYPKVLLAKCTISTSPSASTTSSTLQNSLSSFLLLSQSIYSLPNLRPLSLSTSSSALLRSTLPVLMMILLGPQQGNAISGGGDGRVEIGKDEALFWIWWCVEGGKKEGEELEEGLLFSLVEILSTLSSLSPSPLNRFLSFKLLSNLIINSEREGIQMMLLIDLVKYCPFDVMRIGSFSLVRELLGRKFENDTPSIFKSPVLLEELESTLFRFDPINLLDSNDDNECNMTNFLDQHQRSTLEKLSLYYYLISIDTQNQTGIRSKDRLETTNKVFIEPLRQKLRIDSGNLEILILNNSLSLIDDKLLELSL